MSITSRLLPALVLIGALGVAPACASGQYVYRGDRPSYGGGYGREVERIAHENGYREGVKAGEQDARKGRSFQFDRHDDWRDADDGYRRDFGDREFYRHEFREGFRAGYTDAYNRNARGEYRR